MYTEIKLQLQDRRNGKPCRRYNAERFKIYNLTQSGWKKKRLIVQLSECYSSSYVCCGSIFIKGIEIKFTMKQVAVCEVCAPLHEITVGH